MRVMKTVVVPERERVIIDHIVCDLCKARTLEGGSFDVNDVTVEYESGSNYPEGRNTTTVYFDICSDCFTKVLVPMLKRKGATPSVDET